MWLEESLLGLTVAVYELRGAKKLIIEQFKRLKEVGKIKKELTFPLLGVLIETPAAALTAESLAEHCDFFAIGSNDLTMYTLAIDRGDETVAKIYDPAHLSVLKLIKMTYDAGKKKKIPVSICGEIAGDAMFTPLLIGMGINILSMSTSRILKIKQVISSISSSEVRKLSDKILQISSSEKIKEVLENFNNKIKDKLRRKND